MKRETGVGSFVSLSVVVAVALAAPLEKETTGNPESTETAGSNLWAVVKVCGAANQLRFVSQATGEYLYAAADDLARDAERRRVFTWTDLSTIPESDPRYWDKTADWIVEEEEQGFTLKNVRYNEYLYSAADDLALSEEQRSVFTWKNYDTLGFEGYWTFSEDMRGFLEDAETTVLLGVEIRSVRYDAPLLPGSFFNDTDSDRRDVFVDRTDTDFTSDNSSAVEGSNLWSILKVDDTDNQIQFINQATGEFLYADELMRNPERRRVFTWKNLSTTPVTDLSYWDQTADWIIVEEDLGFTLKNVRYDEYLYSAADDLALSKRQRSVFTWKNYDTLGFEGYWKFNEDMRGFLADSETTVMADVEMRSVRYDAPLRTGGLFRNLDTNRRNVFVDRASEATHTEEPSNTTESSDEAYADQTISSLDLSGDQDDDDVIVIDDLRDDLDSGLHDGVDGDVVGDVDNSIGDEVAIEVV